MMIKVIGVRFRTAGKVYFFDPLQFDIKRGDNVIVETARGIEFGTVVSDAREVEEDKVVQPLKPVIRIASERDKEQEKANKIKEREAFKVCLEKIQKHKLEMKLIDAEYTFDNNKVLFYFTADGRIDFRNLVKDLASVFKTRIELRQIGVRDETKIMGGIGICGRPLCCHSYLSDFIPVSIKMAKEQNLSLNPTKISGVCGRLMCCLKNEEETYEELNRRLPGIGDTVMAEDGSKGEVQSVNVLRQLVKVVVEEGDTKEIREYEVGQLHFKRKHTKKERMELSAEELEELERLEKVEMSENTGDLDSEKESRGDRRRDGERGNRNNRRTENERGDWNDRRAENEQGERNSRRAEDEQGAGDDRRAEEERGAGYDRPAENEQSDRRERRGENRQGDRGDRNNRYDHRKDRREAGERNRQDNERGDRGNRRRDRNRYDRYHNDQQEKWADSEREGSFEERSENGQDGRGYHRRRDNRRNRQGRKPEQNGNADAGNTSERE